MDLESPLPFDLSAGTPRFVEESRPLAERLQEKDETELRQLFNVSERVAQLNASRYQKWRPEKHPEHGRPALYAYTGAVYKGIGAYDFDRATLDFAQAHLRILSGLYGLLRPTDAVLPYRLDMGTKLQNPDGPDLYDYWRPRVTQVLKEELESDDHPDTIVLASKEYAAAVDTGALPGRTVHCSFKEERDGKLRQLQYQVKLARGLMARYICENRLRRSEELTAFDWGGYAFREDLSDDSHFVFVRGQD